MIEFIWFIILNVLITGLTSSEQGHDRLQDYVTNLTALSGKTDKSAPTGLHNNSISPWITINILLDYKKCSEQCNIEYLFAGCMLG